MIASDAARDRLPSGRFVLRINPGLHASLRETARATGMSLNEYCARKLAAPQRPMDAAAVAVLARAASILGDALVGVAVFGSWARGDAASCSDVDVLLVAADSVPISRGLYRSWDRGAELVWDGRQVTPHFVHLPSGSSEVSGLWAEVAQDGLVIHECRLVVSRFLADVRRRILRGEMVLRTAGGQAYWVREP